MKVIEIKPLENGGHRNQSGINYIPKGYAQIPDDMPIPDTFPFVNIEVADEIRYKDAHVLKDITQTIEMPVYDDDGNVIATKTKEYTTQKMVTEQTPYTVKVVTSMTEGIVPPIEPVPEAEPTTDEILDALLGVNEDE